VASLITRMLAAGRRMVGRESRATPLGQFGGLSPLAMALSTAGVVVTPQVALTFTGVFSAINVLSSDYAALGVGLYRKLPEGGRALDPLSPIQEMIAVSPDEEMDAISYRQSCLAHVLSWGNSYSHIDRLRYDGSPAALYLLDPAKTRAVRTQRTRRLYYERDDAPTLRAENVLHFAGLGYDGISGYSPVAYNRNALGLAFATEAYGSTWFGNGSRPSGFLKTVRKLSKEAKARLREQFEEVHQGPYNSNRLAVLEEGLEFQGITIPPDDAQFLATRAFQLLEICRMFRIPPHKLMDFSRATFSNIEQTNLDYLCTSLLPWVLRFEAQMNFKLLLRSERQSGMAIRHTFANLLRADATSRANYYKAMQGLGVLSPDQICDLEDLNPTGAAAGAKHFVMTNLQTLEDFKAPIAGPGPVSTPGQGEPDPEPEGGGGEPESGPAPAPAPRPEADPEGTEGEPE
jgi:HK97 family phage portal protein